jgi:hypothetical protein
MACTYTPEGKLRSKWIDQFNFQNPERASNYPILVKKG